MAATYPKHRSFDIVGYTTDDGAVLCASCFRAAGLDPSDRDPRYQPVFVDDCGSLFGWACDACGELIDQSVTADSLLESVRAGDIEPSDALAYARLHGIGFDAIVQIDDFGIVSHRVECIATTLDGVCDAIADALDARHVPYTYRSLRKACDDLAATGAHRIERPDGTNLHLSLHAGGGRQARSARPLLGEPQGG